MQSNISPDASKVKIIAYRLSSQPASLAMAIKNTLHNCARQRNQYAVNSQVDFGAPIKPLLIRCAAETAEAESVRQVALHSWDFLRVEIATVKIKLAGR